jgi:hypothetical protein
MVLQEKALVTREVSFQKLPVKLLARRMHMALLLALLVTLFLQNLNLGLVAKVLVTSTVCTRKLAAFHLQAQQLDMWEKGAKAKHRRLLGRTTLPLPLLR